MKHEEYFVEEQENGAFISRPTERKDGETRKDGEVMFRKGDATRHTNVKFKSDDVATNKKKDVTVFLRENYDKWDKDWLRTFNVSTRGTRRRPAPLCCSANVTAQTADTPRAFVSSSPCRAATTTCQTSRLDLHK